MKLSRTLMSTALICLTGLGTTAHAAITNGQFTDGLSHWDTLGDVSVQSWIPPTGLPLTDTHALVLSTASLFDDDVTGQNGLYNLSGQGAAAINAPGGVADFAQTTPAALELDPIDHSIRGIEGSAARQSVTVQAGDTLRFQWNLISRDHDAPDTAWLILAPSSQSAQVFTLAQADQATLGAGVDAAWQQTGWQTFAHTFTQSGAVSLSWAVADMNDWGQTSYLAVQQVQLIAAVPEPTSAMLALVALGTVGFRSRKGGKSAPI